MRGVYNILEIPVLFLEVYPALEASLFNYGININSLSSTPRAVSQHRNQHFLKRQDS